MELELETGRLIIKKLASKDVEDFFEYRSDPEVTRYQNFEPYTREQAAEFIKSQKDRQFTRTNQWFQFGIFLKEKNKLIGDCALGMNFDEFDNCMVELGCSLSRSFQGNGYAKETLLAVIEFLFTNHTLDIHRVTATIDEKNIPSIKLFESLQFRKEGHFIENIFFKGSWGNEVSYALLKREWNERVDKVR